jgi:glucose/arabinose dehydrogenase/cytochrome c553
MYGDIFMPDRATMFERAAPGFYRAHALRRHVLLATSALIVASATWTAAGLAANAAGAASACAGDNGGITLPPGFCATVFADKIGHARQMTFAPNGVLYVNTWSGRYYQNDAPPPGGFLVALKDTKGEGRADVVERFGPGLPQGAHGGTGIGFYKGGLFAEQNDKILRYPLSGNEVVPNEQPQTIISGLPLTGDHPMHPFIIDAEGNLYVDLGSATNSCQIENRTLDSPGHQPCTELETRAGIWRYEANKKDQPFSPAQRYATGLRNGEGFAVDSEGHLFVTQHGRDQLQQNWPKLYTAQQSAAEPAEEIVELKRGADYGWPECYYDRHQQKLVLAPEYGGDGGHKIGVCAEKTAPIAAFPAHWAPNDLKIYSGKEFPPAYQGGAFVAFHGSWNRAPEPQGGYNVVFQPLKDGKAAGEFVVFADGFAGAVEEPGQATYRPSGLVVGPDGALYISEDKRGRIWRVTYHGDPDAKVAAAPAPKAAAPNGAEPGPPEGIHPDAGRLAAAELPVPAGATRDEVALGERIFHGEAAGGTCTGCHGSDANGSPQGPSLTNGHWLIGDGSLKSIHDIVANGIPKPRNYSVPMPAKGGAPLTEADVDAVAAYVWAISHPQKKG